MEYTTEEMSGIILITGVAIFFLGLILGEFIYNKIFNGTFGALSLVLSTIICSGAFIKLMFLSKSNPLLAGKICIGIWVSILVVIVCFDRE